MPQFPTITICNRNLWQSEAVDDAAQEIGDTYYNVLSDIFLEPTPPYNESR